MDKVEFLSWEHHLSLLVCVPTYRRGMQREADCSWSSQRKHYVWRDEGRRTRASEAPKSFLKSLCIRKWCVTVSTSPSFKMRSKCSTGGSWQEAACWQCLCLVELWLVFLLCTKDLFWRLCEYKETEFYQFQKAQLSIPAMISLSNTWTLFPLALSLVDIMMHRLLRECVFVQGEHQTSTVLVCVGFQTVYIWLAKRRMQSVTTHYHVRHYTQDKTIIFANIFPPSPTCHTLIIPFVCHTVGTDCNPCHSF